MDIDQTASIFNICGMYTRQNGHYGFQRTLPKIAEYVPHLRNLFCTYFIKISVVILGITLVLCYLQRLLQPSMSKEELIVNGDFERDFNSNWYCDMCNLNRSTDSLNGLYAAMVTNRIRRSSCLRQNVNVTGQKRLLFHAHVKLLDLRDKTHGQRLETYAILRTTSSTKTVRFGKINFVFPSMGYVEVGGDFETPSDTESITLMILNDDPSLNYLVDEASLTEVEADDASARSANQRIDHIRKGDITITYNIGTQYDPSNVTIFVDHRRHDFKFGLAVSAARMFETDSINRKYQNYVYSMSNIVTISNAFKWRYMEPTEGKPLFDTLDKAVEVIRAHNVSIRGHCLIWAKDDKIINWLKYKSPGDIHKAVDRRLRDMAKHYKGKFIQYDMNNENLHGFWYEAKSSQPQFTFDLIKKMHTYDPDTRLCLNDYNVVASGTFTTAYKDQAEAMLSQGVPISCLGVQCHFSHQPEPDALKVRLDTLAETGLKIFVTELDFREVDQKKRAKGYEDALRLFFSHPAVEGIIIWGPWNMDNGDLPTAIVEGDNFEDNLSGKRIKSLVNGWWRTNEVLTPSSRSGSISLRGFYGSYDVTVEYDGDIRSSGKFYLAPGQSATYEVKM